LKPYQYTVWKVTEQFIHTYSTRHMRFVLVLK